MFDSNPHFLFRFDAELADRCRASGKCPLQAAIEDAGLVFVAGGIDFVQVQRRGKVCDVTVPLDISERLSKYRETGRLAPAIFSMRLE